jgi:hypothetical protein
VILEYGAATDGEAVSPVRIQHLAVTDLICELVDKEDVSSGKHKRQSSINWYALFLELVEEENSN